MKKNSIILILSCLIFSLNAHGVTAELVMAGGKTWDVKIIQRIKTPQKDSLQLSINGKIAGIPVSAVKEINYDINLNIDKLIELKERREYSLLIKRLNASLKPYEAYEDIPSNLTKYKSLLMELYFLVNDYDNVISFANNIEKYSKDDELKSSAQVFLARSFIKNGSAEKAEDLLRINGWFDEINSNSNPEKLFILAELMRLKEDYNRAMELVSYIIAFNSQDTKWMQPSELLCAELYVELKLYESAKEVINQISLLYPDSIESEKANELAMKIDLLESEI